MQSINCVLTCYHTSSTMRCLKRNADFSRLNVIAVRVYMACLNWCLESSKALINYLDHMNNYVIKSIFSNIFLYRHMPLSCNNNSVIVQRREKVTISYGYLKENRNLLGLDRFFIYSEEERGRSILHSCKEAESKVSIPARKSVLASAEKQAFAHAMKSCRK